MVAVTKFDERHCHKWALLLRKRREKLKRIPVALHKGDFDGAKRFFSEVFRGVSGGKSNDPGMAGSLLYHMAMITKMETETRFILEEYEVDVPDIAEQSSHFYNDFVSDVKELTKAVVPLDVNPQGVSNKASLSTEEKIGLFNKLT